MRTACLLTITLTLAVAVGLPGASVAAADGPAGSSVLDAARGRDTDAVRALLRRGVDVNTRQADGATALHWAAHWNDLSMAKLLLDRGARVNQANDYGATALW